MLKQDRAPIELEITKTAFGGDGVASLSGKICFVEGALPGEKVLAEVLDEKKNYLKARVLKIIQISPARLEAPCPYYAHCGGCQYQHVLYSEELKLKEAQLREILERAGIKEVLRPIVHSKKDYGYRNSVTLHVISSGGRKEKKSLGFIARDNSSKIPVKNCLLADEKLSPIFRLSPSPKSRMEKINFKLSENGQIVSDAEERFLRIKISGETLLAHSQGFFQNNLEVTDLLTRQIRVWIETLKPESFFDLYAGVGTFSVLCASETGKIFCVEENRESVKALRMNREEKKLLSIEIVEGRVEKLFPGLWEKEKGGHAVVLLDPPRQGLSGELANFISAQSGIYGLIYVSCDPATLVRDLKTILNKGHFEIKEAIPFDMFPRTKHIEVAVLLMGKHAENN